MKQDPFLFDVDGVCNVFTQPILDAVRARLNREGHLEEARAVPNEDAITTYKISDHVSELTWKVAADILSNDPDHWAELRPVEQALKAVDLIRSRGGEVVFVTSPWDSLPTWGSVRWKWLHAHFAAKRDQLVITPRKELVRGRRLYEDNAETARKWTECNAYEARNAVVIAQPWNQDAGEDLLRWSWDEALAELEDLKF